MSTASTTPNLTAEADSARLRNRRIETGNARTLSIYTGHLIGRYRRSGLFWTIGLSVYTVLMVMTFPSFQDSGALDVSEYPESMREAFNITTLNAIEPFLSAQVFSFVPLVLAFYPITILADAIAGAEERGSLDVLLGTPLSRRNLVLATWIAVATVMIAMLLILSGSTWLTSLLMDVDLSATDAFGASLNLFPISMVFGSLALLVSAIVRQRSVAIGVPVATMFAMYLVNIVGKISSDMESLRYVSAFGYYGDAIQEGVPWGGATVLIAASVLLLIAAIPAFDRRDVFA